MPKKRIKMPDKPREDEPAPGILPKDNEKILNDARALSANSFGNGFRCKKCAVNTTVSPEAERK